MKNKVQVEASWILIPLSCYGYLVLDGQEMLFHPLMTNHSHHSVQVLILLGLIALLSQQRRACNA